MYSREKTMEKAKSMLLELGEQKEAKDILEKLNTLDLLSSDEIKSFHELLINFLKKDFLKEAVYISLIALAAAKPINLQDIMLENFNEQSPDRIVTSDRYQFYKNELLKCLKNDAKKTNPYTRQPFHEFDLASIRKFTSDDLNYTGGPVEEHEALNPFNLDSSSDSDSDDEYDEMKVHDEESFILSPISPMQSSALVISSLMVHAISEEKKEVTGNQRTILFEKCCQNPADAKNILLNENERNLIFDIPEFTSQRLYNIARSHLETAAFILQNEILSTLLLPPDKSTIILIELLETYPALAKIIFSNESLKTKYLSPPEDASVRLEMTAIINADIALLILNDDDLRGKFLSSEFADVNEDRLDQLVARYANHFEFVTKCNALLEAKPWNVADSKPFAPRL